MRWYINNAPKALQSLGALYYQIENSCDHFEATLILSEKSLSDRNIKHWLLL